MIGAAGTIALAVAATPVWASQGYVCVFAQECIGDRPCDPDFRHTVKLRRANDGWSMILADGKVSRFARMRVPGGDDLRLLSSDFDPDAGATAMLSLAADGQAVLSTHGNFPTLGVVTHLGSCTPEDD